MSVCDSDIILTPSFSLFTRDEVDYCVYNIHTVTMAVLLLPLQKIRLTIQTEVFCCSSLMIEYFKELLIRLVCNISLRKARVFFCACYKSERVAAKSAYMS